MNIVHMLFQGDWSLYVEQLTLDQVQSAVMKVLRAMYPNITVPEPIAVHMPAWHSNPLYRGSYSNWGPSYVPAHPENLKATLNNRLWFAGEATSIKYFGSLCRLASKYVLTRSVSGFLHGAYFEGQSAGYAIAACIHGKGSCERPHIKIAKNARPYPRILALP